MALDLEQVRRQYAAMTDEALLEVDPSELVEAARQCYQEELRSRNLRNTRLGAAAADEEDAAPERWADDAEPDWLAEGLVAMSDVPDRNGNVSVADARLILRKADIACFIVQRDPEKRGDPITYDLMVQPGQHLLAMSILDRDFFNPQLVQDWQAHFEALSDEELMEIDADLLVAGMRDRIERLVRAYEDELLKRGLAELETE